MVNSCKKNNQSPIASLFTGGTWQLASVMAFNYIGNQQTSTDTLNTTCDTAQFFTFNKDYTCNYSNYSCTPQPTASGSWSLTADNLYLMADMTCKSDTGISPLKPFINAQIINLGQFSMVLNTGDISPNYSLTKKRRILQYGFIRQKVAGSN
jgi:hypothetical protein